MFIVLMFLELLLEYLKGHVISCSLLKQTNLHRVKYDSVSKNTVTATESFPCKDIRQPLLLTRKRNF